MLLNAYRCDRWKTALLSTTIRSVGRLLFGSHLLDVGVTICFGLSFELSRVSTTDTVLHPSEDHYQTLLRQPAGIKYETQIK